MRKYSEKIMKIVFLTAACVSILAVILICVFLFASGVPAIMEIGVSDFLLGGSWKPNQGLYGVFPMIVGSIYFFFFSERIHLPPTLPVQFGMGSLSAMMGGLFAMQGPPAIVYFVSSAEDKDEYIALTQWYFFLGNLALTFFRASHGFLTPTVGKMWLVGVPAGFLGLYLGEKVYKKLPARTIRKVVYAYMALAGILTLIFAR